MHHHLFSSSLPTVLAMLLCGFATAAQAQAKDQDLAEPSQAIASRTVTPVEAHGATPAEATATELQAQATTPAPQQPTPDESHIVIGSATEHLFALQRSLPAQRPRPIDGEQASRSHQRYLKSFETTIPEKYETGLDVKR